MTNINGKFRHWSFHRQYLGKTGDDIEQVLQDIIGVYSAHPTAPLSLHSRMKSFEEQDFLRLDELKLAFRIPAMRLSIYMLHRETTHLVFSATVQPAPDPVWEKRYSQKNRYIPPQDYENWKKEIVQLTNRPMSGAEIKEATDIPDNLVKLVLNRMAYEGSLLRVGATSLRSNKISYVTTNAWAGNKFSRVDSDEALIWLAGEYLRAFGPARIKDFQWWAGITAGRAKAAISNQETMQIDDDYVLLAKDLQEFESFTKPVQDNIAILPRWDTYTMGYAPDGRERLVSPDMQHHIYGSIGATGGNALGAVLVNGKAHGSWDSRFAGNKMTVNLNMFEKPAPKIKKDIENEFNEIAALLKAKKLVVENSAG